MTTSFYSAEHHESFEMDGMFAMEDDYGEFIDLDSDDDTAPRMPLPPVDREIAPSIPMCGLGECFDQAVQVCGSRIEDDDDPDSLVTSPPILTPSLVDAISEDGLPWSMQDARWDRLFASSRDGTSFGTFLRRVRGHGQTVIVARTSDGRIVGGYATDVWSGRKRSSRNEASDSFLFVADRPAAAKAKRAATTPAAHTFIPGLAELGTSPTSAFDFDFHHPSSAHEKPHVEIYKTDLKQTCQVGNKFISMSNGDGDLSLVVDSCFSPTSAFDFDFHHSPVPEKPRVEIYKTELKQTCQVGNKFISMSNGDGDLSLIVDSSFSHGASCTREDREEFGVVEFEVYGFSED
eukprot:CAMPEP_0172572762 /NCGR_PEP_ID=MMETSP1067-20121228/135844_1 /TAXON_ID=265564 ORGANISM="Thalassiosira punctigera, Strain Tpunct2005C2" /NCGR_SAMPLE_ID=MMETSP1067 /ASSEMBLY_ACC=CAM_ASM_000444 /LENGTH=347 /DNA_ID=CAMNT_0013365347 /DNA_START=608 /DNA_END=1651 /DNA_ORIENTATION=-